MAERHTTKAYVDSFQSFLRNTNEKAVFYELLSRVFRNLGITSVLDIGAGNGDLALPLARLVSKYHTIEQNPRYAALLRAAGLTVFQEEFPGDGHGIGQTYDLVLSSHSSPWPPERYTPFLRAAWRHVTPGGTLLVITYDDEKGKWIDFRKECGLPFEQSTRNRLEGISQLLATFGDVRTEVFTTFVRTKTLEEMLQALSFVYSDGEEVKLAEFFANKKVPEYLLAHAEDQDGFFFPFQHLALQVQKFKPSH